MVIQSIKPEDGLFCCASRGGGNFTEIGGAWRSENIKSRQTYLALEVAYVAKKHFFVISLFDEITL